MFAPHLYSAQVAGLSRWRTVSGGKRCFGMRSRNTNARGPSASPCRGSARLRWCSHAARRDRPRAAHGLGSGAQPSVLSRAVPALRDALPIRSGRQRHRERDPLLHWRQDWAGDPRRQADSTRTPATTNTSQACTTYASARAAARTSIAFTPSSSQSSRRSAAS